LVALPNNKWYNSFRKEEQIMNERIRELRNHLGISRSAFGKKIGVSGDVVNNLERGRVEIKEDRIKLICSTFGVNADWLRYGKGNMFPDISRNQEISNFVNNAMELPDRAFKKRFIEALKKLDEEDWKNLEKIAAKILSEE